MKRFISVSIMASVAGLFLVLCSQPVLSNDPPTPVLISLVSVSPTEAIDFIPPNSTPVPVSVSPAEAISLETPTSKPNTDHTTTDFTFADLADTTFIFCGGAGAWSTEVKISPDGSFSGYYSDLDMGDSGVDYPNGTQYECLFSGKFSDLKKTGEYEYSMQCVSLTHEGTVNEEKIKEDGLRYITSDPYGFDNADAFILYLPGKKIDELPVEYAEWVGFSQNYKSDDMNVLPFYGLYNVGGKEGFSS